MRPVQHGVISAVLAIGYFSMTKSWMGSWVCFLSGILIDMDHHLDYWIVTKKIPYNYQNLKKFCFIPSQGRVYLILHAYEFLFIVWLAIYYLQLDLVWTGLAVGISVHLFCDQLTNPVKPLFYFLSYRVKHGFDKTQLLTPKYFEGNY